MQEAFYTFSHTIDQISGGHGFFIMIFIIPTLFGYLCGSIPFGLLLTHLFGLGDVRAIGSGNIGATNVLRTGHKGIAAATLLLDILKGTSPIFLLSLIGYKDFALMCAGLGAFLGHVFPIWLRFRGGKGVATYLGVILGTSAPLFLVAIGTWLSIALLLRYSSLAALVMSLVIPTAFLTTGSMHEGLVFGFMTLLIFIKHTSNVRRLINGTEPRIGHKT